MHTLQQLVSGELKGVKHVRLSCGLTEFPRELFELAETLEVLDLSKNQLSRLPEDFGRFSKLRIAFFSENVFSEFPKVLSKCKVLSMIGFKSNQITNVPENALPETTRWLILTNNKIKKLPASIGKCKPLQKVALAGNLLETLPVEMANCKNLELLRISANKLQALPQWLLGLPKLSWLAFSGNPFSENRKRVDDLQEVDWTEFEILEQLGEGASGNIFKARWTKKNSSEVAIKVFKGEVTSDGFPEDEMRVAIAAGVHPSLVALLGKIKSHPQQRHGLVMHLIPSSFSNLGMPPSMETCSRDTFPATTVFSATQILNITTAIASTATHLHEQGINHGDLYAHNTLIDKSTNTLIGDFGAASFYDKTSEQAKKIEQLECRAFGCMLDDLLMHLQAGEEDLKITKELHQLKVDLMQEDTESRPLFSDAYKKLKTLS